MYAAVPYNQIHSNLSASKSTWSVRADLSFVDTMHSLPEDFKELHLLISSIESINSHIATHAELELSKKYSNERRRQQFLAGRALGRKLLGGVKDSILQGEMGEPLWPEGFAGSISHSGDFVGCVVTRNPEIKSLGLDIEQRAPVRDISRRVATEEEAGINPFKLFVSKEATYKALFPLLKTRLGFKDVTLSFSDENRFEVQNFDFKMKGYVEAWEEGFASLVIILN